MKAGLNWLSHGQNEDGGFGDTPQNYSNISTTMLVVAAFHAADQVEKRSQQIGRAEAYIQSQGGIPALKKRYGKDKTFAVPILANCAMAGIASWKEVSALPFEAACVPQRFYNLMQLPVVSYAIPALVAIGQAKFILDPPWDPIRRTIRRLSIKRSLRVLEKMQPSTGGFLEAVPLTSFVSMALIKSGRGNHPVVKNGIRFILDSFRVEENKSEAEQGSWPIDTNLATWNTTLSINALANRPAEFKELLSKRNPQEEPKGEPASQGKNTEAQWHQCLDWVLSCQNTTVHPFTGAAPGGWGWSDLSGAVPDADDTPGALIALKNFYDAMESGWNPPLARERKERILVAKDSGLDWLIRLQNRDKGWPTFCRGFGKLPFDRSGTDITAHAIRGLLAWQDGWQNNPNKPALTKAIRSGFDYLRANQHNDGFWLPLWFGNQDMPDDINPCYGTAKVLMAFREAKAFDTNEARIGLRWLRDNQNSDGGWGGGNSRQWPDEQLGSSSVEETALCTEILLDDIEHPESQAAAMRGVQWLINAVEMKCVDQSWPIGFYFAKLWYYEKMYPLIFATSALAKAMDVGVMPNDKTN